MVQIIRVAKEAGALAVGTTTAISLSIAAAEGTLQLLRNAPTGVAELAMVFAFVTTLKASGMNIYNGARRLFGLERMETDREKLLRIDAEIGALARTT